ncbi:MAG TPA: HAMP domain-containing sensor histidine kinase [Candidatus Binatia bacterium]|nr:HAMP domain-containing sensor histidine kinase [Candidatus Binatia bacterium]
MTAPRSLRVRLTAFFVGGAAVTLLAASLVMNVLVERAVWGPVDAELEEEAETLCMLARTASADELQRTAAGMAREPTPGSPKFVRVADAAGAVLAQEGVVPAVADQPPLPGRTTSRTVRVPGRRGRMRVVSYAGPDGCASLVGAQAERHVRTLAGTRWAIAGIASGLLVAFAVLSWTIAGRATSELGRLAAEVETIEAGSLAHRLAARRTLEIDRLVTVLNRLLERLETAMTHLHRFTAEAAHELRTPIAGLRARLEGTLGGPRSETAYRDGLLDALEQAERLGSLSEHLLALSAVQAGVETVAVGPVRLDVLAREVSESLDPVAQEQGRRFACRAPHPVALEGRAQLLKRVLLNVVDNAFRHTPSSSAVTLAVRMEDGTAVAEVADEGPGISPDAVARAFDRFHRGSGARGGSGLGLALCHEIVARHRGTIAMRSDPAGGTTVTIRLPA